MVFCTISTGLAGHKTNYSTAILFLTKQNIIVGIIHQALYFGAFSFFMTFMLSRGKDPIL